MSDECTVCGAKTSIKCELCNNTAYCCQQHQKQHWPQHQSECYPFKIVEDGTLGRHLVASRDIKEGEVVLREKPLVSGPPQSTGPLCLGCYKTLTVYNAEPCVNCGWPMCSAQCASSPDHRPECHWTSTKRTSKVKISQFVAPHPTYSCLTPLRCCYMKFERPDAWAKLMSLESHDTERRGTPKYESDRFGIAKLLRRFYCLENDFTEEEILKICGIIQINGHEVPLSENGHVSIYWRGSLLEHSCRANCCKSFSDEGELLIRAAVDLRSGDHLSICYTDPLWSTPARRHHLADTKYFSCFCLRCSDPTELGSYMSAVLCTKPDCLGRLLPESFLKEDRGLWRCDLCGDAVDEEKIGEVLCRLGALESSLSRDETASCNAYLEAAGALVPVNHCQVVETQLALAQNYGQSEPGGLAALTDEQLAHKEALCRQLLTLIRNVVPAECRLKGVLLFELHAAIAENVRRKSAEGLLDATEVRNMLLGSKVYLEDCAELLKYEPEALPEGQILVQAEQNLSDLDNLLRNIHLTIGDSPI